MIIDSGIATGSLTVSGSLLVSGSTYLTGSLYVQGLIVGTFSGSSATASLALNSELLEGLDSGSFESTSSFNTFSGSVSTRVTNLENFSSSYNTGSFSGSFHGQITGSFSGSLTNFQGTPTHIPYFSSSQVLADSAMFQVDNGLDQGYSIAINEDGVSSIAPEALYVYQASTSSYNVISGKGNLNNYLQLNIQNTNNGTNASSDVVATANNGNETTNFIDMGINGANFAGTVGAANDAYLYSTGNDLILGNYTDGKNVRIFNGSNLQDKLSINSSGNTTVSGSLTANQGITASNALINGTITAQTLVVSTVSSSVVYSSGSNKFGNSLTNTQQLTGSVTITGSLSVNNNNVILSSQTSSMSVLSSSYAQTASYALNVNPSATASYALQALSSSYALTASYLSGYVSPFPYTGSAIISGSLTVVGPEVISGSLNITGSNTLIGTKTVTGSLNVSGSTSLVGNITISGSQTFTGVGYQVGASQFTGSVNITGSTVQTGNNNLIGNTTLSGSLTISGSQGLTTTNINIFGDTSLNGTLKLKPVNANIDTGISASYIFVSGTTNDLYFSQNGSGYSNVTRLRWLEGNLYTGLLNGGVITSQSSTVYQVSSGSGLIVNLNASLNDNPFPTISYVNWGNLSQSIAPLTASYQQAFVGIQSNGTIYQQGTPLTAIQNDSVINIGNVLFQNQSTINGVKTQPYVAYGLPQRQDIFTSAFGPLKLSGYTLAVSGSSTGSLVVGSGTAYADGANYTTDPNSPSYVTDPGTSTSKIFRYYDSGSTWVYLTNNGTGYGNIDPSLYSNNGTLTSVGAGNWSIQRCFWYPNSTTKAVVVYYGNAAYSTKAEAIANINIETFTEAPNTAANAIYLGAIIISGNGSFTNTNEYVIYPGGLFRQVGGSGGGGSVVTQTLTGLSDVSISGPTNLQPFVYSTTTGKWINSSAISASVAGNATSATSASYATTASYALNVPTTASYALTASYVLNAVSSSFVTAAQTASYVLNAVTASYILNAVSSSYALTASYHSGSGLISNAVSSSYAATASYVVTAQTASYSTNFTASNLLVSNTITAQTLVVQTITSSVEYSSGSNKFGSLLINTQQFTGSVTITGSLGVMTLTSASKANVLGYDPTTGLFTYQSTSSVNPATSSYALQAATASYVLNAVSASYTQTASYASTLTVGSSQITTATVASSIVGANNLFTAATGSFTSAFYKYTATKASNARAGEVIAVWNAGTTQYTDIATLDIGSTADLTMSVSIVTAQAQLNAQTNSSGWKIVSQVTYL